MLVASLVTGFVFNLACAASILIRRRRTGTLSPIGSSITGDPRGKKIQPDRLCTVFRSSMELALTRLWKKRSKTTPQLTWKQVDDLNQAPFDAGALPKKSRPGAFPSVNLPTGLGPFSKIAFGAALLAHVLSRI
jgi:hypothetical protein